MTMTKDEAAITLADLISEHRNILKVIDNPGAWIDIRDALDAYRNAPEGKSVEVVVREDGTWEWADGVSEAWAKRASPFASKTKLRITVLSRPEDEHPMPGGPY